MSAGGSRCRSSASRRTTPSSHAPTAASRCTCIRSSTSPTADEAEDEGETDYVAVVDPEEPQAGVVAAEEVPAEVEETAGPVAEAEAVVDEPAPAAETEPKPTEAGSPEAE